MLDVRMEAVRRVAMATDFEVVRAFELFSERVSAPGTTRTDDLIADVPESLRTIDNQPVLAEFEERAMARLPQGTSIVAARTLLVLAAEQYATASLVVEVMEDWVDDRQLVEAVLAVGAVGAVWLVLCSLKGKVIVKGRSGSVTLEKDANTADQLRAFADVIRALRGLPLGSRK
jgi:hypothetical protein